VSPRPLCLAALLLTATAMPAAAQQPRTGLAARGDSGSALACPREGTTARLADRAAGDSDAAGARSAGAPRGIIDTVVTLDITDRTWQRDSLSAGVSLGMAGTAGARRAPWHACAGATATLGRITATLHNVHGRIHLRADPTALEAIGRAAGTPPPAPPRR
jgi:hypothetical protein